MPASTGFATAAGRVCSVNEVGLQHAARLLGLADKEGSTMTCQEGHHPDFGPAAGTAAPPAAAPLRASTGFATAAGNMCSVDELGLQHAAQLLGLADAEGGTGACGDGRDPDCGPAAHTAAPPAAMPPGAGTGFATAAGKVCSVDDAGLQHAARLLGLADEEGGTGTCRDGHDSGPAAHTTAPSAAPPPGAFATAAGSACRINPESHRKAQQMFASLDRDADSSACAPSRSCHAHLNMPHQVKATAQQSRTPLHAAASGMAGLSRGSIARAVRPGAGQSSKNFHSPRPSTKFVSPMRKMVLAKVCPYSALASCAFQLRDRCKLPAECHD